MNFIYNQRMRAEIEGDFVVFLIGMRINKLWKLHKWWPVFSGMPKMLKELKAQPELGLLGYTMGLKVIVQYWRSFEHLEAYAHNAERLHLPAWQTFNTAVGRSREDVGLWHETFLVRAGEYETLYSGMPPFGLGAATRLLPATRSHTTARGRLATSHKIEAV